MCKINYGLSFEEIDTLQELTRNNGSEYFNRGINIIKFCRLLKLHGPKRRIVGFEKRGELDCIKFTDFGIHTRIEKEWEALINVSGELTMWCRIPTNLYWSKKVYGLAQEGSTTMVGNNKVWPLSNYTSNLN